MIDVNETAVLDYIFSQQDRVGNIDYIWTWAFVNDGKVHYKVLDDKFKKLTRVAMSKTNISPPEDIKHLNPVLVQRTILGDNDAGALFQYANYTKKFEMLEEMRHMSSELYNKLQALNLDFKKKGPLYQYAAESFGMLEKDLIQFVINVDLAASALKRSCKSGLLRFDLNSKSLVSIMSNGDGVEESVSCE